MVAFCDDHIGQNHDQPMGEVKTQIPLRASVAQVTQIISRIGQTQPDVTREEVKNGRLAIRLTEYPVFIESVSDR